MTLCIVLFPLSLPPLSSPLPPSSFSPSFFPLFLLPALRAEISTLRPFGPEFLLFGPSRRNFYSQALRAKISTPQPSAPRHPRHHKKKLWGDPVTGVCRRTFMVSSRCRVAVGLRVPGVAAVRRSCCSRFGVVVGVCVASIWSDRSTQIT